MPGTDHQPFIEVRGLHKRIGEQHILRGLDLTIRHGESLAIICASWPAPLGSLRLLRPSRPATSSIAR